jgi:pSer/pThr/pTyr-binding forkhead associated (FHA) protein
MVVVGQLSNPQESCSPMELRLVVASGSGKGKVIPISASPFMIGRNPVCQLRPASDKVSNRHCTIWLRGGIAVIQDMKSTNGTVVNGERITDERELHDGDQLQIGPLVFKIQIEMPLAVDQQTPVPPKKKPAVEDAAAMILLEHSNETAGQAVDAAGVPLGETKLGMPAPPMATDQGTPQQTDKAGQKSGRDTASAADAIYARYRKRPRK